MEATWGVMRTPCWRQSGLSGGSGSVQNTSSRAKRSCAGRGGGGMNGGAWGRRGAVRGSPLIAPPMCAPTPTPTNTHAHAPTCPHCTASSRAGSTTCRPRAPLIRALPRGSQLSSSASMMPAPTSVVRASGWGRGLVPCRAPTKRLWSALLHAGRTFGGRGERQQADEHILGGHKGAQRSTAARVHGDAVVGARRGGPCSHPVAHGCQQLGRRPAHETCLVQAGGGGGVLAAGWTEGGLALLDTAATSLLTPSLPPKNSICAGGVHVAHPPKPRTPTATSQLSRLSRPSISAAHLRDRGGSSGGGQRA